MPNRYVVLASRGAVKLFAQVSVTVQVATGGFYCTPFATFQSVAVIPVTAPM